MKKNNPYYTIGILLGILILASGLMYYFNYSMKALRQDYDGKISALTLQTSIALENLSSMLGLVNLNLESFKEQNQQQINTLSRLIEQIEQQSNIKLEKLKEELKDVKIKSADFSAIVDDVLEAVVSISTDTGQGSGVIVDKRGYIVTNVHVLQGASKVRAKTYSGKSYNVDILAGYNSDADIAVLKIDASGLKALKFGNSDDVKVGQKVIAAGNPAGLSFTVTEGIVSALRKADNNLDYIQTDVPINPGNSGGPLINTKGEIIGINNFKVRGFEGLGFAIASNDVMAVVDDIIADYEAKNK